MLRSAFGVFLILTVASLGFVSFLTREHANQVPNQGLTAAPRPAALQPATQQLPTPQSVAVGAPDQTIISADSRGHFATEVEIDGRLIHALVDTGASLIALTSEDAAAIGLRPSRDEFRMQISTANGITTAAPVRLHRVRIGNVWIYDVDAIVSQPGVLQQTLLGMSALRKLHNFEFSAGRLVLTQ